MFIMISISIIFTTFLQIIQPKDLKMRKLLLTMETLDVRLKKFKLLDLINVHKTFRYILLNS